MPPGEAGPLGAPEGAVGLGGRRTRSFHRASGLRVAASGSLAALRSLGRTARSPDAGVFVRSCLTRLRFRRRGHLVHRAPLGGVSVTAPWAPLDGDSRC